MSDQEEREIPAAAARSIRAAQEARAQADQNAGLVTTIALQGMGYDPEAEREAGFRLTVTEREGRMFVTRAPLSPIAALPSAAPPRPNRAERRRKKPDEKTSAV